MRFVLLGAALALGLAASPASAAPRAKVAAPASEAAIAAALISAHRQAYGLGPVVVDARLNQAAEYQARANAASGGISHGDFHGRVRAFGIRGTAAENLAAGTASVEATVAMWKASSGHNANMLIPEIRRIGLARAIGSGYGNYWTLVVSQ
jgi:uncharacterized protein YkwD